MNKETALFQAFMAIVLLLPTGLWAALAALRVIRRPSRVNEKRPISWFIRVGAKRHFLAPGNVRFYAWMTFSAGAVLVLMAIFALSVVIKIALFP